MRRRRVAGLLLVVLPLLGCGKAEPVPPGGPVVHSHAPAPPPAPSPAPAPFDLDAALALIEQQGFTPEVPETALRGPIRAISSTCTGSANGRCRAVFFFDGQAFVQKVEAGLVRILEQDGRQVRLEFPQYGPDDPGCCPSGQPSVHTIRVDNGGLVAEPPVGWDPNRPSDY
ncbi:LppP/LprE family lipoprotein [Saccharopolyspora erythraea]|uniref:LppP/LprE family lipoprotein n=1 Tax=Saccharopolyspora erythraea TaxID=1836 RepID=UPI001BA96F2B|nr:LppP/LprE family lipoprotein [Saccharopolyspora erythraea]QUH04277.1 LppP/LprE family lipoprotein [Saccharopolyspora erythraea]